MTPLTHISLVHDIFPIHLNKLVMDFGGVNVFHIKKLNYGMHLTIGRIRDCYVSL